MTTMAAIDHFLAEKSLAVVGVSRSAKKFGNLAFRTLSARGYTLYPVNTNAETVEGVQCYPNLRALPERVGGVLIVVPPAETERVVREVAEAGIRQVWMQKGAESEQAISFCRERGISAVHGECILMFARSAGFPHSLHRFGRKIMGRLPS